MPLIDDMFGYRLEADFDFAREKRRSHLWWVFAGGIVLCMLCYSVTDKRVATQIFQAWVATILFYGENFYVRRADSLNKSWLWKSLLTTVPLHVCFLWGVLWLDRMYPQVVMKAIVFMPVIALGFAIETILTDRIVATFNPNTCSVSKPSKNLADG